MFDGGQDAEPALLVAAFLLRDGGLFAVEADVTRDAFDVYAAPNE